MSVQHTPTHIHTNRVTLIAESEAMINTSHKVYIDRSLAFSRENHVVDF